MTYTLFFSHFKGTDYSIDVKLIDCGLLALKTSIAKGCQKNSIFFLFHVSYRISSVTVGMVEKKNYNSTLLRYWCICLQISVFLNGVSEHAEVVGSDEVSVLKIR